jgi:hypothetical protein
MRAIRTWGSVRGVPGDWYPYRDRRRDATRAPIQRPGFREGEHSSLLRPRNPGAKAKNPGGLGAEPPF